MNVEMMVVALIACMQLVREQDTVADQFAKLQLRTVQQFHPGFENEDDVDLNEVINSVIRSALEETTVDQANAEELFTDIQAKLKTELKIPDEAEEEPAKEPPKKTSTKKK